MATASVCMPTRKRRPCAATGSPWPAPGTHDAFEFVEDLARWGYKFRFGLFKVSDHDMAMIVNAVGADATALGL